MHVTRRRRKEKPLSEFPGWGLEIMIGLCGENQIRSVIESERHSPREENPVEQSATHPIDGATADLDAVSGLVGFIGRFRRH
ncbi:hypothetical protein [Williamsia sterculiae]|uniref:Uncharacterized protein n=1 Tax=Williamsia sterculiae TaxID=1344003 RepID=A0A1N7FU19_9NOCA|nr:hypothetical protein [Williamsia sterculiae]SIS03839.1 hypothetical protein SAMN05445060_2284 [Williamsia sterculiae]